MKKILLFILAVPIFGAIMAGSLVVAVNKSGGLPPSRAWIGDLPVLCRFIKVQEPDSSTSPEKAEKDKGEKVEESEKKASVSLLDMAPKDRIAALARDLEKEKKQLQKDRRKLKERRRELAAWEKELTQKRKEVLKELKRKKSKLEELRQEIQQKKKKLEEKKVALSENKQSNLEKTAGIFGRMDAVKGAQLLAEMYKSGKEKTVVQILYLMRDRNAAELLGALPDEKISAQITSRLSYVQNQKGE